MRSSNPHRLTRYPFVLLTALVILSGTRNLRADDWNSYRITTRDGLPQNTVTALAQTPDGRLWIGTFDGLACYDGVEFEVFERATLPTLASNRIQSLHVSSDGTLWIGTQKGHVLTYADGQFVEVPTPEGLSASIVGITEAHDGSMWIAADTHLLHAPSGASDMALQEVTQVDAQAVHSLFTSPDGTLWVGTSDGAGRIEDGRYVAIDGRVEDRESAEVRAFSMDADGVLWLLPFPRRVDGDRWIREPLRGDFAPPIAAFGSSKGTEPTWIACNGRLDRVDFSLEESPSDRYFDDLALTDPRCVLRDVEGNLWIGTTGSGLLRLTPRIFLDVRRPKSFFDNVGAVAGGRDGAVWYATGHALLVRVDPDGSMMQIHTTEITADGTDAAIQDLASSPDGTLWIARDDGVFRKRGDGTFERVLDGKVLSILALADGAVIAARDDELVEIRGAKPRSFALPDAGLLDVELEHPYGTIWFHDETRVGRIRDGRAAWIETETPLPRSIRSLWVERDGTLWVSSYGDGLARVVDGRVDKLTPARGLFDASLGKILPGPDGQLWINSNRGVFRVTLDDLTATIEGRSQRVHCEGAATPEGNGDGGFLDASGIAWFSTIHGIVGVDPDRWHTKRAVPRVAIRSIVVDGIETTVGNECDLLPGDGDLEIRYAAPSLSGDDSVHYRYKLEGHDREWVEAGSRRSAFYTNLSPGHYRFLVEAAGIGGEWGESATSLEIEALPLLTESLPFRVGVVLLGSLMLFLAHRWRTARLESWNARLRREIEDRERAEAEQHALQEQLAESKRIETIGRLAGGIAHDFNNFLTVMVGHAELLRQEQQAGTSREAAARLDAILDSCRRASALTRQLLGYSRQQVRTPSRIDPDEVIAALLPLLQRLLPETIQIQVQPSTEPICVHVDRGQLEQVLMNLAINARDAMPNGGPVWIRTRKVELDAAHAAAHPDARPGEHVEISVADVGCGIREQILPHVFEPFFTTKNAGEGTGLGLASVHGIVVQSGGHVVVDSLADAGTTFRVYLPSIDAAPDPAETAPAAAERHDSSEPAVYGSNGSETILVCEDNHAVRQVICRMLRGSGYSVLEAPHPSEARRLSERVRKLDLLVTDVVMPDESGPRVAEAVQQLHPHVRVLFISGYTENEIGDRTGSDGPAFLQKPFESRDLLRRVRQLLDTTPEPSAERSH